MALALALHALVSNYATNFFIPPVAAELNAWISLGYNTTGFTDRDFSAADYTAKGPFIRFRFKFDQNSVKEAIRWVNQE
jgi:hypothetical protein